jgi:hypothetical protein
MADITKTQALPAPFIEGIGKTFAEGLTQKPAAGGLGIQTPVDTSKFAPSVSPYGGLGQAAQQAAATQAGLGSLTFDPTTGGVTGVGAGTGVAGYEPYLTGAAGLTGPMSTTQRQAYESPYTTAVIDAMKDQMADQYAAQQNQMSAQALQSGAFGGGRFGAQQAVADTQYNQAVAGMVAQQQQQAFQQAQMARQQDYGQQMQLAQQQPQLAQQNIQGLGALGQTDLGYRQSIADAQAQAEKLKAYEPYQRYGFFGEQLTGLMGGYPGGSRMQITPTASPLQQGLMTGLGALSGAAGLKNVWGGK